jgi:hypothetical protein
MSVRNPDRQAHAWEPISEPDVSNKGTLAWTAADIHMSSDARGRLPVDGRGPSLGTYGSGGVPDVSPNRSE